MMLAYIIHQWAITNGHTDALQIQGAFATLQEFKDDPRNAGVVNWPTDVDLAATQADIDAKRMRAAVNTERDRRMALPQTVDLGGGKTFPVDTAEAGIDNVDRLSLRSLVKKGKGAATAVSFTDANNTVQTLTHQEMIVMGEQVSDAIVAIHAAATALKAMNPIPVNYKDDQYWP